MPVPASRTLNCLTELSTAPEPIDFGFFRSSLSDSEPQQSRLPQIFVDVAGCDTACPHRRGNALDRTVMNIAYREDAGHTCLKQKWSARKLPCFRQTTILAEVFAGEDKAWFVAQNCGRQP